MLHPEIDLDKFYKGEVFLEIPKFRANVFWQLIWFPGAEWMCLELGFNSDPISILLRAGFNVLECYKVIVQTFLDWNQWSSEFFATGKFFDVCQSSITSNAQIYRLSIYKYLSSVDQMLFNPIDFQDGTPTATVIPSTTGKKTTCWRAPFFYDNIGIYGK